MLPTPPHVERSTCVDLYKFADLFSVASSAEFCSLSVNQLTEIISHDELDVKEETTVLEAVVRWVQHSREDRQHHLPSILPYIRFNLLTSDDTAAILGHPLVREDPRSSEVIRNVVQRGNSNQKPRLGMTMEMALLYEGWLSFGMYFVFSSFKRLLLINPQEGKHIIHDPADLPRSSGITVTSDNNIYILYAKELEHGIQMSLIK
ncbi:kelch repeat and BTB domain-containing protein 2-like [Branchiostoma lanceolatum]|uniref:kelch repeat and BTB domain-containing protein 2-like n=1 Tax=Branchiostoma lanceolatum TaxID=7740 RepID=UPI00345508F5